MEYENDYEKAKSLIDQVIGYFQFKSDTSAIAAKGIKILVELRRIIRKNKR